MNQRSLSKGKRGYPNKIFNRYYLPFSPNEKILFFSYFTILGSYLFSIFISKSWILLSLLPIFLFIIFFAFYSRVFKQIKTGFGEEKNIIKIEEILAKQERASRSTEQKGLFLFELDAKKGTETMVILCENNSIYFNSFYDRQFYSFRKKNLSQLEKLIKFHIGQNS